MLQAESDHTHERVWERNFTINIGQGGDITHGNRCYTDGSKTIHGSGAGVCMIKDSKVVRTRAYGLSKTSTVFQAELHAIKMSTVIIKETVAHGKCVNIMCDSQAALKALENVNLRTKLAKQTKMR